MQDNNTLAISKNTAEAAMVALRNELERVNKDIETGRGFVERYPEEKVWAVCYQSDVAKAERLAYAMQELELAFFGDALDY
jgi:hypothetical protein